MGFSAILAAASAGTAVAIAAGGIAAVLAVSAVFYVIGRGEDREHAQQPPATPPASDPPPAPAPERPRLSAGARPRRRR